MTKKTMMILCVLIICALFVFNIYLYYSNNDMNNMLEDSTTNTEYITQVSKFRSEVNMMSQAHKLYLITSKEEYKKEYNTYLQNTLSTLNNLEKEGVIKSKQKNELSNAIQEYKIKNESLEGKINYEVSPEVENLIVESNETQLSVLGQFDKSIEEARLSVKQQNDFVISASDSLKKGVQGISGIVTAITSGMMYFLKNPKNKETLTNLVECLEEQEIPKSSKVDIKKDPSNINIQDLENIEKNIIKYNEAIDGIKLVYIQNPNIKEKFNNIQKILLEIEKSLYKLKFESNSDEKMQIYLEDIKNSLIDLKINIEILSTYNDFSLDIFNFYIDKYK